MTAHVWEWNIGTIDREALRQNLETALRKLPNLENSLHGVGNQPHSNLSIISILEQFQELSQIVEAGDNFLFLLEASGEDTEPLVDELLEKTLHQINSFDIKLDLLLSDLIADNKLQDDLAIYQTYVTKRLKLSQIKSNENLIILFTYGLDPWVNLYEKLLGDLVIPYRGDSITISKANILLNSPNREVRSEVYKSTSESLSKHKSTFSIILNQIALVNNAVAEGAGFPSWFIKHDIQHDLPEEARQVTADLIIDNAQTVRHFYHSTAKRLDLKSIYDFDRYAAARDNSLLKWSTISSALEESFESFHPDFGNILRQLYDKSFVDVFPRNGKPPIDFCLMVPNAGFPFVSLNFDGSLQAVMSAAHELAHAVHLYLSQSQQFFLREPETPLAEAIAAFFEIFIVDSLNEFSIISAQSSHWTLGARISNNVFRYTALNVFEHSIHEHVKEFNQLDPIVVSNFWTQAHHEIYGDSLHLDESFLYWWAWVTSIFNSPGSASLYPFSQLMGLSLYSKFLTSDKQKFAEKLKAVMSNGGALPLNEVLETLDMSTDLTQMLTKGLHLVRERLSPV